MVGSGVQMSNSSENEDEIEYPYEFKENIREKAELYSKQKLYTSLIGSNLIPLILLLIIYISGFSKWLETISTQISNNIGIIGSEWLGTIIFVILFIIILTIIQLPISYYSGYILEHRYDLSNLSKLEWLKDEIKSLTISIILLTPIIVGLFFLGANFPNNWWIYFGIIYFVLMGILSNISHLIFLPLFYDTEEIEGDLKKKLIKFSEEHGIENVENVVMIKAGEKTEKANAAFAGMGKTKRLYLFDTLIDKFHEKEIKSVVAHEIGHYVNKDVLRFILIEGLFIFPTLFIAGSFFEHWASFNSIHNLPLFVLILFVVQFIRGPLMNAYTRYRERSSDRFAMNAFNEPEAFLSSFKRLSDINLAKIDPSNIVKYFFYDHPTLEERMQMVKEFYKEKD